MARGACGAFKTDNLPATSLFWQGLILAINDIHPFDLFYPN